MNWELQPAEDAMIIYAFGLTGLAELARPRGPQCV